MNRQVLEELFGESLMASLASFNKDQGVSNLLRADGDNGEKGGPDGGGSEGEGKGEAGGGEPFVGTDDTGGTLQV